MKSIQEYTQTASGLFVPACSFRQAQVKQRPIAFSLFSGCGGFDLGFMQAGWEVVGGNEFDAAAALTYMVNLCSYPVDIHYVEGQKDRDRLDKACQKYIFGKKATKDEFNPHSEHDAAGGIYNMAKGSGLSGSGWIRHHPEAAPIRNFWFGDVRKLKGADILDKLGLRPGDIDCMMGGPPCQGFSHSGKREIADPRNNLVYEFGRMVVELQPKTFIFENVPGIINMFDPDGVLVLDKFCMMVSEGGYGKWDLVKKAMMMQAGCASVIKSDRKGASTKGKAEPAEYEDDEAEQMSFFEEEA